MRAWLIIVVLMIAACSRSTETPTTQDRSYAMPTPDARAAMLHEKMEKVRPFFKRMGEPQAGDWLAAFKEPGQTFDEWLQGSPTLPSAERRKIYVLPLGDFSSEQTHVIQVTAGYLRAFYGLPVELMTRQPLKAEFPNVRHSKLLGTRQVKTGYIMDAVLAPMLPKDAAALIAFTHEDLYPDDSMAYVFGQASLDKRVGVWSLLRLRDSSFERYVRRTMKIASHELGHMFSMHHCTAYECVMNGTNHIGETDRRPIEVCPECMAKVCYLSGVEPADRYERLAAYCRKNDLEGDAREFEIKAAAVK